MSKTVVYGFKIGEMAVYPTHGVGVIDSIEKRNVSGVNEAYYMLRIINSDATIMVPIKNASSVGLRKVMKKSVITKVYSILKERKDLIIDNQTWNRRYRDYTDKLKTGCAMEVARVLKDLYLLKIDKELSFGERRMLDAAKTLLVKELSVVRNAKEEKIEEEIERIMRG